MDAFDGYRQILARRCHRSRICPTAAPRRSVGLMNNGLAELVGSIRTAFRPRRRVSMHDMTPRSPKLRVPMRWARSASRSARMCAAGRSTTALHAVFERSPAGSRDLAAPCAGRRRTIRPKRNQSMRSGGASAGPRLAASRWRAVFSGLFDRHPICGSFRIVSVQ